MMVSGCSVWKVKALSVIPISGKHEQCFRISFQSEREGFSYKLLLFNHAASAQQRRFEIVLVVLLDAGNDGVFIGITHF